MNAGFTKALKAILDSEEYDEVRFRNVLLHRLRPGRTVWFTNVPGANPPHSLNRDSDSFGARAQPLSTANAFFGCRYRNMQPKDIQHAD